jgi:hypothetical protein
MHTAATKRLGVDRAGKFPVTASVDETARMWDLRFEGRHRKFKHYFAFSRLIECGHCGCSLVGEIKKGRYIYYHCTGYKGKCPEPYTREEVQEDKFGQLLEKLVFDNEVIAWITEALCQSHADEKRYRDEAVAKLQNEYDQSVEAMDKACEDKFDGVIGPAHYERISQKWDAEQRRLLTAIEQHRQANQSYLDHGVKISNSRNVLTVFILRGLRAKNVNFSISCFRTPPGSTANSPPNFASPLTCLRLRTQLGKQKSRRSWSKRPF